MALPDALNPYYLTDPGTRQIIVPSVSCFMDDGEEEKEVEPSEVVLGVIR